MNLNVRKIPEEWRIETFKDLAKDGILEAKQSGLRYAAYVILRGSG